MAESKCFRFLDLPAEIRNHVYALVFLSPDHVHRFIEDIKAIQANLETLKEFPDRYVRGNNLSLLLTCRTVYSEAQTLAFRLTSFLVRHQTLSRLFPNVTNTVQAKLPDAEMLLYITSLTVPTIERLKRYPRFLERPLYYDL